MHSSSSPIRRPPSWPRSNDQPVFYDSVYRNDPVRVVAVVRDLYYKGQHRQVLVVVAESTGKRIEADLYYIENWSVGLDLYCIFATFFKVKNAY